MEYLGKYCICFNWSHVRTYIGITGCWRTYYLYTRLKNICKFAIGQSGLHCKAGNSSLKNEFFWQNFWSERVKIFCFDITERKQLDKTNVSIQLCNFGFVFILNYILDNILYYFNITQMNVFDVSHSSFFGISFPWEILTSCSYSLPKTLSHQSLYLCITHIWVKRQLCRKPCCICAVSSQQTWCSLYKNKVIVCILIILVFGECVVGDGSGRSTLNLCPGVLLNKWLVFCWFVNLTQLIFYTEFGCGKYDGGSRFWMLIQLPHPTIPSASCETMDKVHHL